MISPRPGVVFTDASDGDVRGDPECRRAVARRLRLSERWAFVDQVHGSEVVAVSAPGYAGAADALYTAVPDLPVAVFTADCLGICLLASSAVGVVHAGWRGLAGGAVRALAEAMTRSGSPPEEAYAGPAIGPCCFEVGPEVAERFPAHRAATTWGTTSVDLLAAASDQLDGLGLIGSRVCTRHQPGYLSHRRDATTERMAAIAWLER